MAVLRPHLALTVTDVERSIPFYEALLGVAPAKVRAATRSSRSPTPRSTSRSTRATRNGELGAFNHAGIQVESTDDVLAARLRLQKAGLATFDEMDTTCCYAKQDKIWVHDPDGTPWEIFTVLDDAPVPGEPEKVACC